MTFSDHQTRSNTDIVRVKRTVKEMEAREEYDSLLWEYEKCLGKDVWQITTPVRDVKIGENIYDTDGNFLAYRVN